jgi:hypothetical protein
MGAPAYGWLASWPWFAVLRSLALFAMFFFFVGRLLVVEDPLERAHAIVVVSGGAPLGAIEAARLYR